jgi:hypothetical protein
VGKVTIMDDEDDPIDWVYLVNSLTDLGYTVIFGPPKYLVST